ncbi:MAG TPA: hypothetical protein DCE52_03165 [Rhodobacteraceae bacterium]|nr:OsmC family protein [Alphaproteobacteria bacterium]HAB36996.1 hypothetical protein [Paracoccaceae bacterium]
MIETTKPRIFGPIFAYFDGTKKVNYSSKKSKRTAHPPDGTPIDMMLASLAYCIVVSVIWAAKDYDVTPHPFKVKVTGTKALNEPGRVAMIDITLIGVLVDDFAISTQIMNKAKAICTVSNTLNCDVNVSMDAING